jgi:DNA/RNA-binding domain of Phe-tRNA-synthetase-like protein
VFQFIVTDQWKQLYPGASAGVLVMHGVNSTESQPAFREWVQAVEETLKTRFAGWDRQALADLPVLQAYTAYYRRFKKTYHVQLQLESVVIKGRGLQRGGALLECMFGTELKNLLLTAGHDLAAVQPPVRLKVSEGTESYTALSGGNKILKQGDMFIEDAEGVISSVLYGPDVRTQLAPTTRDVLFTVYAPPGIPPEAVYDHLQDIRHGVLLAAPAARVEMLEVLSS